MPTPALPPGAVFCLGGMMGRALGGLSFRCPLTGWQIDWRWCRSAAIRIFGSRRSCDSWRIC